MRIDTRPPLWLDHVNLPSADPEVLAQWYADRLGLQCDASRVTGPGISIFFRKGPPLGAGNSFHFGLRTESRAAVEAWAETLGVPVSFTGSTTFAARITDPEGNIFEIYWDNL